MTQSKQQDKIQEIMRAVLYYNGATTWGTTEQMIAARAAIESKLRELVREPLSDRRIGELLNKCDDGQEDTEFALSFARAIERAHGIGEEA